MGSLESLRLVGALAFDGRWAGAGRHFGGRQYDSPFPDSASGPGPCPLLKILASRLESKYVTKRYIARLAPLYVGLASCNGAEKICGSGSFRVRNDSV